MNNKELVKGLSEKLGLPFSEAEKTIIALQELVGGALIAGEEVTLGKMLKFKPAIRAERKGINPKTKEVIAIKEKKYVKIKLLKAFDEELNS